MRKLSHGFTSSPPTTPEVSTGRRARQLLYALLLLSTAQRVTPAVAAGILREHLRLTSSEFGLLAGISALAFGLAQFPGGYLADLHGAVRLVRFAGLASAASALIFLLAPNYPLALAGRAAFGISDSLLFIGMLGLAVDTRDGGAFEIGKIQAVVGVAFAGAGLVALGLSAVSFPIVFGSLAIVQAALALTLRAPGARPLKTGSGPTIRLVLELATTRQFWASVLVTTGLFAPFLAWTGGWALPYLQAVVGLSADQARSVIVINAAGAAGSALLLGRLSDLLRRRRPVMLLGAVMAMSAWALLFAARAQVTALLAIVLTSLACAAFPACSSSLSLAKESFRKDRAGTVLGLANVSGQLGAALLGAAVGVALDSQWHGAMSSGVRVYPASSYSLVPAVLGAGSALALLGLVLVTETNARQVPALSD